MSRHKGLRLSLVGVVIFLIGVVTLIVQPEVGAVGVVIGGFMIWGGLVWTLMSYYTTPSGPASPS